MTVYYPVLLDLEGKKCVVVGGGKVAERKVESLLSCGARVEVIAPNSVDGLINLAEIDRVSVTARSYQSGDLAGSFLVVAATDDPHVNSVVWEDATRQGLLVNVVDDPAHCNFIVPSVIRRGDLVVSFSTSGQSPALAKKLRKELEEVIAPEYGPLLELLGKLRDEVKSRVPDAERRAAIWQELVDSDILDLLREGRCDLVETRVRAVLDGEDG